jgi:CO/xanthine dehydrogenase Mo-binding subunit
MRFKKELFADERRDDFKEVGVTRQRADALGHVTARTQYFDDRTIAGLLHLKLVRSPHHHARIRAIDTAAASRVPGVRRIITARDVPNNVYTILSLINIGVPDEPALAFDKVRYQGEPVLAVVADSEATAYEAVAKVRIDYDPLAAVFDVEEALRPGAPLVNEYHGKNTFNYEGRDHQRIRFGDVERGFAQADHVLEDRYQMSPIEHAPTEPQGCIAVPSEDHRITCYTNTQALFFSLDVTAIILKLPPDKLHFIGGTVGGGFGGKVDTLVEPLCILAALLTNKPVRFALSRAEEMQFGPPRGAERIYIKDGITKDGRITARYMRIFEDSGAYSRLSPYGAVKAAAHCPGPYTIPNVFCDAYCVYTNRTPSTAMRGFGVTASDFAIEVQMDKLARLLGMNPMEFRILNAYRDGDMKAHHKKTEGAALIECVQAAADLANWPIADQYRAMTSRRGGGAVTNEPPAPLLRLQSPSARPQTVTSASPSAGGRFASIFGERKR